MKEIIHAYFKRKKVQNLKAIAQFSIQNAEIAQRCELKETYIVSLNMIINYKSKYENEFLSDCLAVYVEK